MPVISLNYPAISEIVRDGENGFLFDEESAESSSSHKIDLCPMSNKMTHYPSLFDCLVKTFCIKSSSSLLDDLRLTVTNDVLLLDGWEATWSKIVIPYLVPMPPNQLAKTIKILDGENFYE